MRSPSTSAAARWRAFVALMNAARRSARPDGHALRQPRRARRARPRLERARRDEARPGGDEQALHPLDRPARRGDGRRAAAAHLERPALHVPAPDRREDRPHERRRLVGGRRRARRGRDDLRDAPRRRDAASGRNSDLAQLLAWGLARYRTAWAIDGSADVRLRADRVRQAARAARRGEARAARRPARTAGSSSASWRPVEVALPVRRGQRLGEVQVLDRGVVVARSPLVAANCGRSPGDCRPSRLLRGPHRSPPLGVHAVIVTVTLNAALDRTLTVPRFQRGHRHRASDVLTLAGGKGINIARALKRLDVPVVATGLAGRAHRHEDRRGADRGGDPQRLRPHLARSRGRRRRSSTRPRARTPRSTSGGRRCRAEELETLLEKLHYLCRGADFVVFAGYAAARRRRELLRRGRARPRPRSVPDRARLGGRSRSGSASRRSRFSSPRTSARPSTSSGRSSRTRRTS